MSDSNVTSIKAVLFDLDGTLLRIRMSEFIPRYIAGLAECCADYVKPKKFEQAMLAAIRSLIRFPGVDGQTNEQRLFSFMQQQLSVAEEDLRGCFAAYRHSSMAGLEPLVKPVPLAQQIVAECQQLNVPLVLATNPVFPEFMVDVRLAWAGLDKASFHHVTSYENSCYCKPQAGYYQEIVNRLKIAPQACLMVGNDTQHDLSAVAIGMQTFLVDTWVIEHEGADWPCEHRGDHLALQQFLQNRLVSGR